MDELEQRRIEAHAALLEILDEAMKVDQAARGKIRVYNPDSATLEIRAQRGFSRRFVESFAAVPQSDALACARAFRWRRRVAVPDVVIDPFSQPYHAVALEEGFRAMQSTPLIAADGRVVGTLSTHFPHVHHPSSAAGLVLDFLSGRAALVVAALV